MLTLNYAASYWPAWRVLAGHLWRPVPAGVNETGTHTLSLLWQCSIYSRRREESHATSGSSPIVRSQALWTSRYSVSRRDEERVDGSAGVWHDIHHSQPCIRVTSARHWIDTFIAARKSRYLYFMTAFLHFMMARDLCCSGRNTRRTLTSVCKIRIPQVKKSGTTQNGRRAQQSRRSVSPGLS